MKNKEAFKFLKEELRNRLGYKIQKGINAKNFINLYNPFSK